jgi:hypothetical protein
MGSHCGRERRKATPKLVLKFYDSRYGGKQKCRSVVRIDTVKIFTTNSTYHCEMHFGTTVAYRRVNLRCSMFASEVLHAVKIVVCFSPKETMKNHNPAKLSDLVGHLGTHIRNDESLICPHENCNTILLPIGHTNVYSSYGWLILARVMVHFKITIFPYFSSVKGQ